ncbi:hypothetical protein ACSBR2_031474 [Camellia fascicularis]
MGLYNISSSSEGFLHVLVINTILSVALLENMVRYMFQVVGFKGFLQIQRKINQVKLEDREEQCPLQSSNLYLKTDLTVIMVVEKTEMGEEYIRTSSINKE